MTTTLNARLSWYADPDPFFLDEDENGDAFPLYGLVTEIQCLLTGAWTPLFDAAVWGCDDTDTCQVAYQSAVQADADALAEQIGVSLLWVGDGPSARDVNCSLL